MKKRLLVLMMVMLGYTGILSAQAVTKDSINVLNNEKEKLKVAKSLNEHKLKLAKLENQLDERTNDVQRTRDEAEKAASDNQNAANDLSSDPQNSGKAKDAKKSGSRAANSAKKARKAIDKLDDLNKDIENLKKKIANDEQKLVALGGSVSGT